MGPVRNLLESVAVRGCPHDSEWFSKFTHGFSRSVEGGLVIVKQV
jgi:hypothetical protein